MLAASKGSFIRMLESGMLCEGVGERLPFAGRSQVHACDSILIALEIATNSGNG
jgi:hypothetical protein